MKNKKIILNKIFKWWKENERKFSWRETKDPYKILCAEIMLQQTNAEKVEPIYNNFIKKYPTIKKVYEADYKKLEVLLSPLGLNKRIDYLKESSRIIIEKYNGNIPNDEKILKELKGVGNYTASAILCFAFEKNKGILDTNTIRILKRVFNIKTNKARARNDEKLQNELDKLVKNNCRDYNYMLLDFGAKICKKQKPLCNQCPINNYCIYYSKQQEE